jgi:hypothetical protein
MMEKKPVDTLIMRQLPWIGKGEASTKASAQVALSRLSEAPRFDSLAPIIAGFWDHFTLSTPQISATVGLLQCGAVIEGQDSQFVLEGNTTCQGETSTGIYPPVFTILQRVSRFASPTVLYHRHSILDWISLCFLPPDSSLSCS